MKKTNIPLANFTISYPLEAYAPIDQIFFIDIETTGFTAKGSSLYMIGGAYFKNNSWHIIQWFADNYDEEKVILQAFKDFASNYSYFIHFNGNNFDIPYLSSKARMLDLDFSF